MIDQIAQLIEQLKNNPESRRRFVSVWNVGEVDLMNHYVFRFYVADGKLSLCSYGFYK
ncbi:thymidylate synthase [Paenibacillus chitinolyticus]|uniref:thymidylate synthase n=1 Tax=Paenibacillus chitinolyticus TaxID=79263 RepID=UPI003AF0C3E8